MFEVMGRRPASPLREMSKLTSTTKDELTALAKKFARDVKLLPKPKDVSLPAKAPAKTPQRNASHQESKQQHSKPNSPTTRTS